MNAPLYNKLKEYKKENISFHMPGHKLGSNFGLDRLNLLAIDNTEVMGLDNLYDPSGVIEEAQKLMSKSCGARETIFLTNGSTTGIMASILAVCKPGDSLIIARNCHHSVWNSLIFGGIKPIYVHTSYISKYNILGEVNPEDIEKTIKDNPHAKAVIIVSPTYEGIASNIEEISKVTRKYNKVLIVDEAHGAHFPWNKNFPDSALVGGADIVIQSMHKNMPAIGQSGLMHLNTSKVNKHTLRESLQMVQTSSPSYMMMASMDYIRARLEENPSVWDEYIINIKRLRKSLKDLNVFKLVGKEKEMHDLDISKIVISTIESNLTGTDLSDILREEYNIQVELSSKNHIIALSTVADRDKNLRKLERALIEIDSQAKKGSQARVSNIYMTKAQTYNPRQVYFSDKEIINIDNSVGKISSKTIMLYPPGIPLVCIGEVFTKEIIGIILENIESIVGITNKNKDVFVSVSSELTNKE